ncbi:MAG: TVP38/TMEM64 family protein [Rhodospirillales bacterium]|nr:TVP38/TMEM64 family protein [Rhodospirillales bacterium]
MTDQPVPPDSPPPRFSPKFSVTRLLPIGALLGGLALFFLLGLDRYVSFKVLGAHFADLKNWVEAHGAFALAAFGAVYAAMVAFSIPGALVLTLAGAMLFGAAANAAVVIIAATVGACAVFLAARFGLGEPLRARAGPFLKKMEAGFRANAFSYMLVLRLVPLFPFWLVNLAPAFLGVGLPTFAVATAIGIAPGTVVFSVIGEGLGGVVAAGGDIDPGKILTPTMIAALIALAALALVPVAFKRWQAKRAERSMSGTMGGGT